MAPLLEKIKKIEDLLEVTRKKLVKEIMTSKQLSLLYEEFSR